MGILAARLEDENSASFDIECPHDYRAQFIRNLTTHLAEPDEQEGLEMLASVSLVARLVERAQVVKVPEPAGRAAPAPAP